ncbi:glycosyltransferase [Loigolactobacillus rennini]|uniref:Glycosyltransferase n=1 Tax=Loigolactobacillus rennini DSM 20253 TaxID=1423796 RepID=A0A0R2D8A1_9LACO|nr:glycosyltransferase [Loigolactobacillus rennini]KRN00184.1 glycosyltransferase [Loigolactobacillus rennini DSM 20253]
MVSVIMSIYNEKIEWIQESIESILQQTFTNFELVIIVDNPKNADIKKFLSNYADNSKVRIFYNSVNRGLVFSLNRAISLSQGSYIARMDADDVSSADRLQTEYDYLTAHGLDFIFTNVNQMSEDGEILSYKHGKNLDQDETKAILKFGNVSKHPTWFLKRCVYEQLGGYRDVAHCEDFDFILRALAMNFKLSLLGKSVLNYRFRQTSISRSNALEQFLKSRYISKLYLKNQLIDVKPEKINLKYSKLTSNDKRKFAVGLVFFQKFVLKAKNKNFLKSIKYLVKALISSRYSIVKIVQTFYFKFRAYFLLKNTKGEKY